MMLGLLGMSYFLGPESVSVSGQEQMPIESPMVITLSGSVNAEDPSSLSHRRHSGANYQGLVTEDEEEDEVDVDGASLGQVDDKLKMTERTEQSGYSDGFSDDGNRVVDVDASVSIVEEGLSDPLMEHVMVCGIKLTKRQTGMLAAAFCGCWGVSN